MQRVIGILIPMHVYRAQTYDRIMQVNKHTECIHCVYPHSRETKYKAHWRFS